MTGPHWTFRLLAVAAAVAVAAVLVEGAARYHLTTAATARRTLSLWIVALAVLGLAAPSAVTQLRAGVTGRRRRAVAWAFVGFDLLGALVIWGVATGGDELGSRLVLVGALVAPIVLLGAAGWAWPPARVADAEGPAR